MKLKASPKFRWLAFSSMLICGGGALIVMLDRLEYHPIATPIYIIGWIILSFASGRYEEQT